MDFEIRGEPLKFDLYGISGDVVNHDYAGTGKRLMDELWRIVRENKMPNTGKNHWVYWTDKRMSTCVEIKDDYAVGERLEKLTVSLEGYVYYRYVGPYDQLGGVHRRLEAYMSERALDECGPRVEKYGDWTEDESELVTEVFIGIN